MWVLLTCGGWRPGCCTYYQCRKPGNREWPGPQGSRAQGEAPTLHTGPLCGHHPDNVTLTSGIIAGFQVGRVCFFASLEPFVTVKSTPIQNIDWCWVNVKCFNKYCSAMCTSRWWRNQSTDKLTVHSRYNSEVVLRWKNVIILPKDRSWIPSKRHLYLIFF